jgi:hypothetical protein
MEIRYLDDEKCGIVTVNFIEWDGEFTKGNIPKKYFFDNNGMKILVPEAGIIPGDCRFILPKGITGADFEDAVLNLANEIINNRNTDSDKQPPIDAKFTATTTSKSTNEDKLIDIIHKLVNK